LSPVVDDAKWMLIDKNSTNPKASSKGQQVALSFVPAKTTKRRCPDVDNKPVLPDAKRSKLAISFVPASIGPTGLAWDGVNFSCAYDALFTILHNIWCDDNAYWGNIFQDANQYLSALSMGFNMYRNERISIEDARDNVRHLLHKDNPTKFPMGAEYASAVELAIAMCSLSKPISTSEFECIACGHTTPSRSEISYFVELQRAALGIQKSDTIAKILGRLMSMPSNRTCTECKGAIQKNTYVDGS
jgi:hypothetical protein